MINSPSHAADTRQLAADPENATFSLITRRIIPLVFIAYLLAYLDRINVGYAQLQMQSALGFSDIVYGVGAGVFSSVTC